MELGLTGQTVSRILIDFDIYIEFDSGDTVELGDFTIKSTTPGLEIDLYINSANLAAGLAATLLVLKQTCTTSRYNSVGDLFLSFSNGLSIAAPHGEDESWEFSRINGYQVISGPGGTISTWSPK